MPTDKSADSPRFYTPDQIIEGMDFETLSMVAKEIIAVVRDESLDLSPVTRTLIHSLCPLMTKAMLAHIGGQQFADDFWRKYHSFTN